MSDPKRSVDGRAGALGLTVLTLGMVLSASLPPASGQTPRAPAPRADDTSASPTVEIRAPIGPRPEFYVPWSPNAPGLTAKPVLKRGGLPRYPDESIKAKETGFTTLELCITADGHLTDIRLAVSSGFPRLDQAVLDWAPTATYSPAMFQGSPLAICGFRLTYEWRIDRSRSQQP